VFDYHARLIEAHLEDEAGNRIENVAEGEPIRINVVLEALVDMDNAHFNLTVHETDGKIVFDSPVEGRSQDRGRPLSRGQRVRLRGSIENQLTPGRHSLACWVARSENLNDFALQGLEILDFIVYGTRPTFAPLTIDNEVTVTPEEG
jgi:hypothetical protein